MINRRQFFVATAATSLNLTGHAAETQIRDIRTISRLPKASSEIKDLYDRSGSFVAELLPENEPYEVKSFAPFLTKRDEIEAKKRLPNASSRRHVMSVGLEMLSDDLNQLPVLSREQILAYLKTHFVSIQVRVYREPVSQALYLGSRCLAATRAFQGKTLTEAFFPTVAESVGNMRSAGLYLPGRMPSTPANLRTLVLLHKNELSVDGKGVASARSFNQSPRQAWLDTEKAIEISRTLDRFEAAGFSATYHSCDVVNESQMSLIVDDIRKEYGPICGIIHGAGVGKDASFQRKESLTVERCLSAKLDGLLNLISLTQQDPIQALIAFGSISGRFGANGHTDYSLANDMLAKIVAWHRQLRPTTPATTFHWHAWDDIGMATKPETRMALELIGMKLMPAKEGANHFLREIDAGLPLSEVLITDTRYFRMFYPADRILTNSNPESKNGDQLNLGPLIHSSNPGNSGETIDNTELNPITDPFLAEHRLNDRPLLPFVIIAELLAESASHNRNGQKPMGFRDLEIVSGIKFPADRPRRVQMISSRLPDGSVAAELRTDFHLKNGTLVSANRLTASSIVEFNRPTSEAGFDEQMEQKFIEGVDWRPVRYSAKGSDFYVGSPLRCLRKYAIERENKRIWGRISAPSLGELAGAQRDVLNWLTPSSVLDAMLFASGILAWNCRRPGVALPQRLRSVRLRRLPRPAEVCWVRSQIVDESPVNTTFDMSLWGTDECPLLIVQGYVAVWLSS